jgi:hypothetical protein
MHLTQLCLEVIPRLQVDQASASFSRIAALAILRFWKQMCNRTEGTETFGSGASAMKSVIPSMTGRMTN